MNADEVVKRLREYAKHCDGVHSCWNDTTLLAAADLIESLQAQLDESQRREQAAVDDLYEACKGTPCNNGICVKKNCTGNHIPCDFEWRGPHAGKGETE